MTPQLEITEVRDLRTPFILIVSSFTVALLMTVSAFLIGYIHGQDLRCGVRKPVAMSEIAQNVFYGSFGE